MDSTVVSIVATEQTTYRALGIIIFMRGYCRFYHYEPGEQGRMVEIKISEITAIEPLNVTNL